MCMMLWSQRGWQRGLSAASCYLADSSKQANIEFMCQRLDSLIVPSGLHSHDRLRLQPANCFHRIMLPPGALGVGETDLAHKARVLLHTAKLQTGTTAALEAWRLSVRGVCADQGVEHSLVDIAYVEDPDLVARAVENMKKGEGPEAHDPMAFFFPRAVLVTGPLHIIWNSFQHCVEHTEGWQEYKSFLAAVLAVLGNKGLRERFLEVCVDRSDATTRRALYGWKHRLVSWKWEYMEEVFETLSGTVESFLKLFDGEVLKTPVGFRNGTSGLAMDPSVVAAIAEAQSKLQRFVAMTEAYHIFASTCGRASRWFGGCKCHDWIWRQKITVEAKARLFAESVDSGCNECVWRGRRGPELARGRWCPMVELAHIMSKSHDRP